MSDFHPRVVALTEENTKVHPNADSLSIADVDGFPVVFRTEDFPIPCLAAYIPEDSVMPDDPKWDFLGSKRTVTSRKLRGQMSIGMLAPLPDDGDTWVEGSDITSRFGITKRQEPDMKLQMQTEDEHCPHYFPKYTDLESYARHAGRNPFAGKVVRITEKLHGSNGRAMYKDGRLWMGSRTSVKKRVDTNVWWRAAEAERLEEKLKHYPGDVFFGEVYGSKIQGSNFAYDAEPGSIRFRVFDIFDTNEGRYLDWYAVKSMCSSLDLDTVPILYEGAWDDSLVSFASGKSTLSDGIREGIVVTPTIEQRDELGNRIVYKVIGDEYREEKDKVARKGDRIHQLHKRIEELERRLTELEAKRE